MKKRIAEILVLIGILCLGYLMGIESTQGESYTYSDTTTVTIERDSFVFNYRDSLVLIDRPNLVDSTIYDTVTQVVYKRIYSDTIQVDEFLQIMYWANVTGTLNDIKLGYIDQRPDKIRIVETTNTIDNTTYIKPAGIYLGARWNSLTGIGLGGSYLKDRHLVSAHYFPKTSGLGVGYSFKIFK